MSFPINEFSDLDNIDIKDLFYYGKNTDEQHATENTSNVLNHPVHMSENLHNFEFCQNHARSYPNTPPTSSSDLDIKTWDSSIKNEKMEYKTGQKRCKNCKTIDTPQWRWNERGQILCNACKLYEVAYEKKRLMAIQEEREGRGNKEHVNKKCGNCGIGDQGLQWRKVDDVFYCNACGIYLKKHGKQRSLEKAGRPAIRRPRVKKVEQQLCSVLDLTAN